MSGSFSQPTGPAFYGCCLSAPHGGNPCQPNLWSKYRLSIPKHYFEAEPYYTSLVAELHNAVCQYLETHEVARKHYGEVGFMYFNIAFGAVGKERVDFIAAVGSDVASRHGDLYAYWQAREDADQSSGHAHRPTRCRGFCAEHHKPCACVRGHIGKCECHGEDH